MVGGGWGGGAGLTNKINELALVEGNLPSSLVMVFLYSLMHTRQWCTSCFHLTRLIHAKLLLLCNSHYNILYSILTALMCRSPLVNFAES